MMQLGEEAESFSTSEWVFTKAPLPEEGSTNLTQPGEEVESLSPSECVITRSLLSGEWDMNFSLTNMETRNLTSMEGSRKLSQPGEVAKNLPFCLAFLSSSAQSSSGSRWVVSAILIALLTASMIFLQPCSSS